MKKFFYSLFAAATMLFATTSCTEDEIVSQDGNEVNVSFTVQTNGTTGSRAIADGVDVGKGNMANTLVYAVYEDGNSSDVLIQATSLGLKEDDPAPFDTKLLGANRKIAVFDTIYKNTPLLKAAEALGIACAGGRDMLIYQGAASFRIWTGLEPDIDAMNTGFDITPVTDGDAKE